MTGADGRRTGSGTETVNGAIRFFSPISRVGGAEVFSVMRSKPVGQRRTIIEALSRGKTERIRRQDSRS